MAQPRQESQQRPSLVIHRNNLPQFLYRVQYPESATTDSPDTGLEAQSGAQAISADEVLRHIHWDKTFSSPVIGLLCDGGHAENWARSRVRKGQSEECELLVIETQKLPVTCTVFRASEAVRCWGLQDEIPQGAKASIRNEYFIFHCVPASAIKSRRKITLGSPGYVPVARSDAAAMEAFFGTMQALTI